MPSAPEAGPSARDGGTLRNPVGNPVWEDELFKSEKKNGQWAHPTQISDQFSFVNSDDNLFIRSLKAAIGNNGDATIVWNDFEKVYMGEKRSGSWTAPAGAADAISWPNAGSSRTIATASDDSGNTIIVWATLTGEMYMSEYRNGVWSHPSDASDRINPVGTEIDVVFPCVCQCLGEHVERNLVYRIIGCLRVRPDPIRVRVGEECK